MKLKECYICGKKKPEFTMRRFTESGGEHTRFLCERCEKRKCKKCECLLNNKFNFGKWGHWTEESYPLCQICYEESKK